MALSEGFQRYLSSLGGGGLVAPLASGLMGGFATYAQQEGEQRRKKREEEEANRKAGLAAALDFAMKQGRGAEATGLYQQVYGVDAPPGFAEDVTRAGREARLTEGISRLPYLNEDQQLAFGTALGKELAVLRGETPTISEPTGQMIPSTSETEPVPGRRAYSVNEDIPLAEAQGLAGAGLGRALMATPGDITKRRIKEAIPAVAPSTRPKMVPEMVEKPRYILSPTADARETQQFKQGIRSRAANMHAKLDSNFAALDPSEQNRLKNEYAEKSAAIDTWAAGAIKAGSESGLTTPTTVFAGAKTLASSKVDILRQAQVARTKYLTETLGIRKEANRLRGVAIANTFTLGRERNDISRASVAIRNEALNAMIARDNTNAALRAWATDSDTQQAAASISEKATKDAMAALDRTTQFGKAARAEIEATGDQTALDKFDLDYNAALAVKALDLAKEPLARLKRDTFKPTKYIRGGSTAPAAAPREKPAGAGGPTKGAGRAKGAGLSGRGNIE